MMTPSASPAEFQVTLRRLGADVVASVRGELDCATAGALKHSVIPVWEEATPTRLLVLELSGMSFCDAAGLGALVGVRTLAAERGTTVVLAACPVLTRRLLVITGLDAAFDCYATVAEALQRPQAA